MLEITMDTMRCDADLLLQAYFTASNLPVWKAYAIRDIVNAGSCQHCGGESAECMGIERLIQFLQLRLESIGIDAHVPSTNVAEERTVEASGPWA